MDEKIKKYTVVLLLNEDGSKVLLQVKNRTAYAGMLNGVGGKFEQGESPEECAYREVQEETSIRREDIERFVWLGTLTLPLQCDTDNADLLPELWFFSGIVKDEELAHEPDEDSEKIGWCTLDGDMPISDIQIAGDGCIQYFIGIAKKLLFGGK